MPWPYTEDRLVGISALRSEAVGSIPLFEAQPCVSGVPDIFTDLTPAELKRVVERGRHVEFRPGDELFRQGEPHRGILALRAGAVRSFYVSPNGREITLANWRDASMGVDHARAFAQAQRDSNSQSAVRDPSRIGASHHRRRHRKPLNKE